MPYGLHKHRHRLEPDHHRLEPDKQKALVSLFFCCIVFGAGVWISAAVMLPQLAHWSFDYSQPVRAQVVESRLESASKLFSDQGQSVFSYRYIHQGQLFSGSSYRPDGRFHEAIRAHPPGSMLTAYVDPDQPQYAMVWPGMDSRQGGLLVFGLILLVLSARRAHRAAEVVSRKH